MHAHRRARIACGGTKPGKGGTGGMPFVPYGAAEGVVYARTFALHQLVPADERLFFYSLADNCTNFISQCVWAAYGGWLPEISPAATAENAARIRRDFRMARGVWFGSAAHIGSPDWCRVEAFYDYVTAPKRNGPAAAQVTAGTFEEVPPAALRVGDVVQMVVTPYAPERFGHGLFVTQAGARWADVLICCQSYDRLDSSMEEFSAQPAVYPRLRVLRFAPAVFFA